MDDKNGEKFPWRRKQFRDVIQGKLLQNDGKEVEATEVLRDKIVGLYFSAHWVSHSETFSAKNIKLNVHNAY